MKIASSSWIYKTIHYDGSYLLQYGKRQQQIFAVLFE